MSVLFQQLQNLRQQIQFTACFSHYGAFVQTTSSQWCFLNICKLYTHKIHYMNKIKKYKKNIILVLKNLTGLKFNLNARSVYYTYYPSGYY